MCALPYYSISFSSHYIQFSITIVFLSRCPLGQWHYFIALPLPHVALLHSVTSLQYKGHGLVESNLHLVMKLDTTTRFPSFFPTFWYPYWHFLCCHVTGAWPESDLASPLSHSVTRSLITSSFVTTCDHYSNQALLLPYNLPFTSLLKEPLPFYRDNLPSGHSPYFPTQRLFTFL